MTIEDLLQETGGFGKFQIILVASLFSNKLSVGWSMLQMSFAGLIPDWSCMLNNETSPQNGSLKACSVNSTSMDGSVVSCDRFEFQGEELTIINQWNLVCDMKWVKATVTSIQMAGVLIGAFLAGQMGDYFGRKKTTYLFALEHAVLNIIAAFSVNWEMFAACRFFIGVGIGGILVIVFPYPMEFLPTKWRPLLAILPVWALGVCFFAGAALLLKDWSHVHIACGVLALPSLLGYFYVPESLRWLTVFGRIKEAEQVVAKIALVNNKPMPSKTVAVLQQVAEEEKIARETGQKYTYVDVFRGWHNAKITLTFCFLWFSFSMTYYGISFGVSSLAGSVYLNIFLLAIVELPPQFSTFYFNNKIGRKWTAFTLLVIACLASFSCLIMHEIGPEDYKGSVITGLSLTAKMGIGAGWAVLQTWGAELYPTVTRNLGYGAANTAARVGGIIAPFAINFDDMAVESYILMGVLLIINIILVLVTPETKGKVLADSLDTNVTKGDNNAAIKGNYNGILTKADKGISEEITIVVEENGSIKESGEIKGMVFKEGDVGENHVNENSNLKGIEIKTEETNGVRNTIKETLSKKDSGSKESVTLDENVKQDALNEKNLPHYGPDKLEKSVDHEDTCIFNDLPSTTEDMTLSVPHDLKTEKNESVINSEIVLCGVKITRTNPNLSYETEQQEDFVKHNYSNATAEELSVDQQGINSNPNSILDSKPESVYDTQF